MPNKCYVPGCKTGYASGSEGKNISLFRAAKVLWLYYKQKNIYLIFYKFLSR